MNHGFIIAADAQNQYKLFNTTNGGNTWQDMLQGRIPDQLVDVCFPTLDTGFVISNNYILQTNNGGNEWYIQRYSNINFQELDFIDKNNGVLVWNCKKKVDKNSIALSRIF